MSILSDALKRTLRALLAELRADLVEAIRLIIREELDRQPPAQSTRAADLRRIIGEELDKRRPDPSI